MSLYLSQCQSLFLRVKTREDIRVLSLSHDSVSVSELESVSRVRVRVIQEIDIIRVSAIVRVIVQSTSELVSATESALK